MEIRISHPPIFTGVSYLCRLMLYTDCAQKYVRWPQDSLTYMPNCGCAQARDIKDNRGIHLATYFAELSLPEYSMIKYSYSMIATAAVYLAGRIVVMDSREGDPFPPALRRHSGLTEKAVKPCAAALLSVAQKAHLNQLQAVYKKYGNSKFSEVAKVQIPALDI
jgi:hypothetical protein